MTFEIRDIALYFRDLNVITVSAMQGSTEIQIKGDKDTLMFKKK